MIPELDLCGTTMNPGHAHMIATPTTVCFSCSSCSLISFNVMFLFIVSLREGRDGGGGLRGEEMGRRVGRRDGDEG